MAIVSVASVAAACGEDTADPPRSTSSTTVGTTVVATDPPATSTTTTTVASEEAEVRAVIDRYWEAYLEAVKAADPDHPGLNAVLVGEAKERIIEGIQELRNEGLHGAVPEGSVFAHEVRSVEIDDAGLATVEECLVDDLTLVNADGAVVNGEVVTSLVHRSLVKRDGEWLIALSEQGRHGEGVLPCESL